MDDQELRQLVANYQPSAETVNAMSQVSLVATVGPSATGKNTIMKALAQSTTDVKFVVGETSRAPRPNEQAGVDLFFRTKPEIIADLKAGKLTQVVIGPNGDLYCTRVDNFPTNAIGLFPLIPQGVMQFRALPLKFFAAAFMVPASFDLWQQWLAKQSQLSSWTPEQLAGRLAEAKKSFEFALSDQQIRLVLNDDVNQAAKRLEQVARGQAPDDEFLAKQTAQANYQKLLTL